MKSRARWVLLVLGWVVGCGGVSSSDNPSAGGSGGVSSSDNPSVGGSGGAAPQDSGSGGVSVGPPGEKATGRLTIPVAPLTENSLSALLILEDDSVLRGSANVDLALGSEYPDRFVLNLDAVWIVAGACSQASSGGWTIRSVQGAEGVAVEVEGDDKLLLSFSDMDSEEVTVSGTLDTAVFDRDCGTEGILDFEIKLSIRVRTPARAEFRFPSICAVSPAILSGQPDFGGTVVLWDHEGSRISPLNATPKRPLTIHISGTKETMFSLPDAEAGFGALLAEGPEQTLLLESNAGAAGLRLVAPSSIDRMEASWSVAFGRTVHAVETGQEISMGESWDVNLYASAWGSAGESILCGAIPDEHLHLATTTPDVCAVSPTATNVEVLGWGTCSVEITAPKFDGDEGLSEQLGVHFVAQE